MKDPRDGALSVTMAMARAPVAVNVALRPATDAYFTLPPEYTLLELLVQLPL